VTGKVQLPARRTGIYRQLTRRDLTENQLAALNLKSELDYYPEISQERKILLRKEFVELDSLKRMNMRYLAGAIYIFEQRSEGVQFDAYMFSSSNPVMQRVLERLDTLNPKDSYTDEAYTELLVKRREVLLTYAVVVENFRSSVNLTMDLMAEDGLEQLQEEEDRMNVIHM
jgi:hypothetical protein